jgi:spore coat polysaccharide biosynthesis protein SpsF (cytidylyltransferase family)
MDIGGKTMLERVVERTKLSKLVNQVVVASAQDLPIKLDVPIFIGDEQDVLKRYYDCAKFFNADVIVRITSDCPLILPSVIDDCIFFRNLLQIDYVAAVEPNYPDGVDTEVFTFETLEKAYKNAKGIEREHVTPWIREHCDTYYLDFWEDKKIKTSVDTKSDLRRVRKLWNGKTRPYFW